MLANLVRVKLSTMIDVHAYWDVGHMSLDALHRQMCQHGLAKAILSPPCTQVYEPDKSAFMYAVQRIMLRNDGLRPIAEAASQSFYDKAGHLRMFWRLFTRKGQPINKVLVPDNTSLLTAIETFENLYAWYWVNPTAMPEREQIQRELKHPKVAGLKMHAYWHKFTAQDAYPVFALAEQAELPVYLILGFDWLDSVVDVLREFTHVNVIFGYGGFPYFDKVWKAIRAFPNASVDFSSLHLDQNGISAVLQVLGSERCLYGSDCPYNFKDEEGRFDYSQTIDRITRLVLGPEALDLIFRRNAERVVFGE